MSLSPGSKLTSSVASSSVPFDVIDVRSSEYAPGSIPTKASIERVSHVFSLDHLIPVPPVGWTRG
jgi:hypothetical protein